MIQNDYTYLTIKVRIDELEAEVAKLKNENFDLKEKLAADQEFIEVVANIYEIEWSSNLVPLEDAFKRREQTHALIDNQANREKDEGR